MGIMVCRLLRVRLLEEERGRDFSTVEENFVDSCCIHYTLDSLLDNKTSLQQQCVGAKGWHEGISHLQICKQLGHSGTAPPTPHRLQETDPENSVQQCQLLKT